jgi:hypothetical protein
MRDITPGFKAKVFFPHYCAVSSTALRKKAVDDDSQILDFSLN